MSQNAGVAIQTAQPLPSYAVDRGNRCLWRDLQRLDLPPKAFDVLDYLRSNPNRLVSQDEILDQVWPNRFVQPEIVKTYIRTLRRLLEDDVRRPRFIETRPRSGYRFLGELPDCKAGPPMLAACPAAVPARLLGRGVECIAVKAALDRARTGQRDCVIVSGEAGIGKSMLLDTATASAREEPDTIVAIAYGAPARGPAEPLSLAIALLQDLARQMDPSVLAPAVASHAPGWSRYLSPARTIAPDQPRPGWWPQQMAREACTLLEHLAAQATIVLAVDDLQWVDPDTADLLVTLALRRYPARLLVVATFRQIEFAAPCPINDALQGLVRQGRARQLALAPLTAKDLVAMLHDQPQPTDIEEMASTSGGNPRLLRSLVTSGERRDAMQRHLSGAPPQVQLVLEAGSIAGPRFCAWAVARILETEQDAIDDLLARLAASQQYLRLDGSYRLPDGTRTPIYTFRHKAHHLLLLDSQLPTRRSERFRRFGDAIVTFWGDGVKDVANDVSRAFKSAGDWSGAITYSRLAAQGEAERDRPVEAIRLLTEALDISTRLPSAERIVAQAPIQQSLRHLVGSRQDWPKALPSLARISRQSSLSRSTAL